MVNGQLLKLVWKFARKHTPKLLCVGAISAEGLAMWFMHKEAPVVRKKLDELPPGATNWEKIKVAAPIYIPALTMILMSMGCIVGGTVVGEAKAAELATLLGSSEAALLARQKKAVEILGPEKAQEIEDAVAKDLVEQNPPPIVASEIIATGNGDQLFFEPLSGRYFTSSKTEIEKAANKYNAKLIRDIWGTVNEWYDELGLEPIGLGDARGWNVDHFLDISFIAQGAPNDRTCWVIDYKFSRPLLHK